MGLTAKMTKASTAGPGYTKDQIVKGATAKHFIDKGQAEEIKFSTARTEKAQKNAARSAALKAKVKTHGAKVN